MRWASNWQIQLWLPLGTVIDVIKSPVVASTTFRKSFSNAGTYNVLPSGVIDIRSHPLGKSFSQTFCSESTSMQYSLAGVVSYNRPVAALAQMPLIFIGF